MGKYLTSLLILASSLLLPDEIFADEQVRRVQEELRKRHLFYANPNGEKGPALTAAVRRYQQKKGFPATGVIDSVTLASLGISSAIPTAATTPIVVAQRGQVHGANGERLPSHPPSLWPGQRVSKYDPAHSDSDYMELELANFHRQETQRRRIFDKRVGLTSAAAGPGASLEAEFDPASERSRNAIANPVSNAFALQTTTEVFPELDEIDDKPARSASARSDRRSNRRTRRAGPRKEKNPFVLTYHTVDRAIRSLFGDTQAKKKRSTGKRL